MEHQALISSISWIARRRRTTGGDSLIDRGGAFRAGAGRLDLSAVCVGHPGLDLVELRVVEVEWLVVAGREHDDFSPFGERTASTGAGHRATTSMRFARSWRTTSTSSPPFWS